MWIKKRRKQGQWYNRYIDETFNCVSTKLFNNIWHTMEKREGFFIDKSIATQESNSPWSKKHFYTRTDSHSYSRWHWVNSIHFWSSILSADNRSYHDYSTGSSSLDLSQFINNIHMCMKPHAIGTGNCFFIKEK